MVVFDGLNDLTITGQVYDLDKGEGDSTASTALIVKR